MEQLSREALRQLMERAETIEARSSGPSRNAPWAKRATAPAPQLFDAQPISSEGPTDLALADAIRGEVPLIPIGLERRLVRRAEARWASLLDKDSLPPANAATTLLAPPFANRAMRIRFPALAMQELLSNAKLSGMLARISDVGEAIPTLCVVPENPVSADPHPTAPLARRLVALAATALRTGAACHLDSDEAGPDAPLIGGRPHLLLRAVALPLAVDTDGVPSAIVIASWRKLLSQDETAALHRELAAAISWMHDQGSRT